MSVFRDLQYSARKSGTPGTVIIIGAMVAGFLLCWLTVGRVFGPSLAMDPASALQHPWTLILYPFAGVPGANCFICVLFECWWLWLIGGSVERDMGSARYVGFFLLMAVLGGLAYWFGSALTGDQQYLIGAFMPVSAVTVVWGTRNPNATIILLVLPITGKWLAWLSAALVFLSGSPKLAPFACAPLVLAWAFAAEKLPLSYKAVSRSRRVSGGVASPREKEYYDEVRKREQDRKERERLRKLFESSLDEPDKDR
jgi:membrane associated rhomboid family serine protease